MFVLWQLMQCVVYRSCPRDAGGAGCACAVTQAMDTTLAFSAKAIRPAMRAVAVRACAG
jgi:hypothetical protein